MIKKIIRPDCLIATAGLFGVMWLFIVASPLSFDFLDPMSQMFNDFDYTDLVFSQLKKNEFDDRIVIVNIGSLPKSLIAVQLENICRHGPKVIGIDIFPLIENPSNPAGDTLFSKVMSRFGKAVLATKLDDWDARGRKWRKLEKSPDIFSSGAIAGYVNLYIEDYQTARHFGVAERVEGGEALSFPAAVVKEYSPGAYKKLRSRGNDREQINYIGNTNAFYIIDAERALKGDSAALVIVKDKIVLMGFLGASLDDISNNEDKYFTPMNPRYVGKTDRDMHGVIVHANAVSTILSGNYIYSAPGWANLIIAFLLCYTNILAFSYIYLNHEELYETASLLVLIVEMLLIIMCMYMIFIKMRVTLDLSFAMVAVALSANTIEIYYNIFQRAFRWIANKLKREETAGNESESETTTEEATEEQNNTRE